MNCTEPNTGQLNKVLFFSSRSASRFGEGLTGKRLAQDNMIDSDDEYLFRASQALRVPPRIACLVPSVTELLVALGLAPCLVARTGFCIHPAEVLRAVPKVGGTKDVNLAKLQRLAPTHLIVNIDENRRETVEAVRGWPQPPRLIVTHPKRPEDLSALIEQVAAEFADSPGVTAAAAAISAATSTALAATVPEGRAPVSVLYLIWKDPWMTVARDTYLSAMLARVNWQTLPDVHGGESGAARYPVVDGSEAWLAGVEQVLLSSEPYAFSAQDFDAARVLCPNAEVRLVDGEMLSWYGVRAIAGLDYLRALADGAAAGRPPAPTAAGPSA